MIDLADIKTLNAELAGAVTNLAPYHQLMQQYCAFYEKSAFFPRKAGDRPNQNFLYDNYLQVFADKNIEYTSQFPSIKVDATPTDREFASVREKILYAVHRKSGTELLWRDFAHDATKKSLAIAETYMNFEERCMEVRRYDPRYVFWKMSNGNDRKVTAFWAVFPITLKEAQDTYGVTPTKDTVSFSISVKSDPYFHSMDGQEWFTMAIRWDDKHRVAWIGDKMIEEPHEHMLGVIPVDICAPFRTEERNHLGGFYLQKLVTLQAELNDTIRRRSNIVKRMSNPIVWGRNIKLTSYDDVKAALRDAETGVLGLGKDGEVGILQLQDLKTLYEHESAIKSDMQRLSGFAAASFGESVGANTSGDALGMYFTPTLKHVEGQYISWKAFLESINSKILRGYDMMGRDGTTFSLDGYSPRSTLSTPEKEQYAGLGRSGAFRVQFDRTVIDGNYINRVIMPPIVPKNEIEEKRYWLDARRDKAISLNTYHELVGIESPEDERQMIMMDEAEPLLNPQGTQQILQGMQQPALPSGAFPVPERATLEA